MKHQTTSNRLAGQYRFECECGWIGRWWKYLDDADQERFTHDGIRVRSLAQKYPAK